MRVMPIVVPSGLVNIAEEITQNLDLGDDDRTFWNAKCQEFGAAMRLNCWPSSFVSMLGIDGYLGQDRTVPWDGKSKMIGSNQEHYLNNLWWSIKESVVQESLGTNGVYIFTVARPAAKNKDLEVYVPGWIEMKNIKSEWKYTGPLFNGRTPNFVVRKACIKSIVKLWEYVVAQELLAKSR